MDLRNQIKMSLENAASIGRTGQNYTDYVEKLTNGLMDTIDKIHGEYEKKIEELEDIIHLQSPSI
jgi:hypothetical protein